MPWDGAGNFAPVYIFVNDAAANIKILAARQDAQWADICIGLMNCLARDGQNVVTADLDMGGFKLGNLGTPTLATDAATKAYADGGGGILNGWIAETNPFVWVSGTAFKVTGINVTSLYKTGRRLQIVHNTGATTTFGWVLTSSFAAGDTTVNVTMDAAVALVSTVTSVYYGLIPPDQGSSLPVGTAVSVTKVAAQSGIGAAITKVTADAEITDVLGEFAASRYTALYAGRYSVSCSTNATPETQNAKVELFLYKNGVAMSPPVSVDLFVTDAAAPLQIDAIVTLAAGDYLEMFVQFKGGGTTNSVDDVFFNVWRMW